MTAEFQNFPMWLYHPHETAAVVSDDYAMTAQPRIGSSAPPGQPQRFPPVMVANKDQMEYHLAKGYSPNRTSDPVAFNRAQEAPPPADYHYEEYPRLNSQGGVEHDPDRPPPLSNEYPKWLRPRDGDPAFEPCVVNTRAAEDAFWVKLAARGSTKNEPVEPAKPTLESLVAQMAALQQQMALLIPVAVAAPAPLPEPTGEPEEEAPTPDGLRTDAEALGVKVDKRWSEKRLRQEIDKALAQEAA